MRRGGKLCVTAIGLIALATSPTASAQASRRAMASAPIGNPAEWFRPDDYPAEARRSDRGGRVIIMVGIDSGGKVVSCIVKVSSGTTLLDQKTCDIAMERALFNPATDSKGQPIASMYLLPVRWELPDRAAPLPPVELSSQPLTHAAETELLVGENGNLVSCKVIQQTANLPDPCGRYVVGSSIGNAFVKDGKPVAAIVRQLFSTSVVPVAPAP